MSWAFITWSERKAYRLLSLARNAGFAVPRSEIPMFSIWKDGSQTPYKSLVEIDCSEQQFDDLVDEMFRTVRLPNGE